MNLNLLKKKKHHKPLKNIIGECGQRGEENFTQFIDEQNMRWERRQKGVEELGICGTDMW